MKLPSFLTFSSKLKPDQWLIGAIVVVATWLRFWRLAETLQFLGDQGRDAIIVADIFRKADPVFIGPVTSVGNMYLGPLYYYFMLPFLRLSYPSPMGPVYAVAFLGVLAVYLTYRLGKEMIGTKAALVAALMLALSSIAIEYSRFSWNPNPAQLVGIVMVWSVFKAWKKNLWYWFLTAICLTILIQLHYLSLLSAGGAGLIWLTQVYQRVKSGKNVRNFLTKMAKVVGLSIALFVLSLTPLILFDSKHDWLNANAFYKLLVKEEAFTATDSTPATEKVWETVSETHGRSLNILAEHTLGKNRPINTIFVLVVLLTLAKLSYQKSKHQSGVIVISLFLITAIIGTAFYKHSLFVHYYTYLYPVIFLCVGVVINHWSKFKLGLLASIIFVTYFFWFNQARYPFFTAPSNPDHLQNITQTILDRVKPNEKYNIVLISDTGDIDAQNYRYFLSTSDTPPVIKERRGEVSTLFIIDETDSKEKVTDSPIYEIVVFPNKQPNEVYSIVNGPTITVLRKSD